jgi:magnesium chelatase family protein
VQRYRARVSGPLLDRFDMQVEVPRVPACEFDALPGVGAGSDAAALAVCRARERQLARQGVCNARLTDADVHRCCAPDQQGRRVLDAAMQSFRLSARARQRVLKVARTIADLDSAAAIGAAQVSEAVMLRCLDRAAVGTPYTRGS